ncbi:flagella basal body P-ring formation protein FlgA [Roseovarius azorensis]|uniref:Flagella basal body P-ring formation protein FlgA n=1 Tax=Roseovarius azorensis TaxID=1287727 RepID=A0A1H7R389_9RHOB|nr:flagellar basal body P-ring formation chaperone FlgA [Roseovarius azorensis]SEL54384.1 flagella basal body P-ring formation protein FlgA [Roseovarius azorensis]
MKWLILAGLIAVPPPVWADRIVAARTIRAQEIIAAEDLLLEPGTGRGSVTLQDLIGKEALVSLYPGRPVRAADVGPPALIDRNQIVSLIYLRGGLRIMTEGRALARAGMGEYVRVMNLASRATIVGRVTADGQVLVSQQGSW